MGFLSDRISVLKGGDTRELILSLHMLRVLKDHMRKKSLSSTQEEGLQLKRHSAKNLILCFQNCKKTNFCCLSHTNYFVIEARTDEYKHPSLRDHQDHIYCQSWRLHF